MLAEMPALGAGVGYDGAFKKPAVCDGAGVTGRVHLSMHLAIISVVPACHLRKGNRVL